VKLREFVDLGGVYVPKSEHTSLRLWTWVVGKSPKARMFPCVCGLRWGVCPQKRAYFLAFVDLERV